MSAEASATANTIENPGHLEMVEKVDSPNPFILSKSSPENVTPLPPTTGHPLRFWIIIAALGVLAFISALDVMVISVALPQITKEIGGGEQYVWIANSFVFASAVPQPLIGQLANILGRKTPLLASIVLFIVGSAVNGSARSPAALIAGRTVQGIGAGGIYVLIDIVCCDLVALRERGKYLAIVNMWAAVAAALGPVIGGVLADTNWRWIFYMNLPICAVPLVLVVLFMRVKTSAGTTTSKLRHLDFLGIGIFTVSMVSLLFGLVAGGAQYPWSSWRVILPLVLGTLGWIVFHLQQHYFASNPSVPTRLFSNRTSAVGFALNFLGAVIIQAVAYFLPVYFQAVLGTTILKSGVNFIPITIGTLCFAAAGGVTLSKFGAYRPIHAVMFVLTSLGLGLCTRLDQNTPTVAWAFFEILTSAVGMTVSTVLPAILVALPESDVASATAAFSFIKTFGFVWGVTIPSLIFNAAFRNKLYRVQSSDLRSQLGNDQAYSFASKAHILKNTVDPERWSEVIQVYVTALKYIWWFGLAVAILSFFLVGLERGLELSTELTTEYGLDHDAEKTPDTEVSPVLESNKPQD